MISQKTIPQVHFGFDCLNMKRKIMTKSQHEVSIFQPISTSECSLSIKYEWLNTNKYALVLIKDSIPPAKSGNSILSGILTDTIEISTAVFIFPLNMEITFEISTLHRVMPETPIQPVRLPPSCISGVGSIRLVLLILFKVACIRRLGFRY